jgi:hypothetical protein
MVDALAPRADEGRGITAISFGEPQAGFDPGFPNGATRRGDLLSSDGTRGTWREFAEDHLVRLNTLGDR